MAAAGMCLFALFIHKGFPLVLLAACGLLTTGSAILWSLKKAPSPAATLGLSRFTGSVGAFAVLGCVLGVALGIAYRLKYGGGLLPSALGRFAPMAVLIGSTEEIVFRGYIQGRVRHLGPVWAVVLGALCHTAYKCALFALVPAAADVSIWILAAGTFLGGL